MAEETQIAFMPPRNRIDAIRINTRANCHDLRRMSEGERPYSRDVALAITALEEAEWRLERALIDHDLKNPPPAAS